MRLEVILQDTAEGIQKIRDAAQIVEEAFKRFVEDYLHEGEINWIEVDPEDFRSVILELQDDGWLCTREEN